jgi:RecA/RadA recombinase
MSTPTAGMTTIALTLIAHAQATGDLTAYINLSHTFDAEYATIVGVDLAALLLVRQFSREASLHYDIVEKLAQLPRRGREPKTIEAWRALYEAIRVYIQDGE